MSKQNFVTIGRLQFSRDDVENGRYGKVYRGSYENLVNVSIFRIDKSEFQVDQQILRTTDMHPNIVRFYGSEEDAEYHYIAIEESVGTLKELVCGNYKGPHFIGDDNMSSFDYQSFGKEVLKQTTSAIAFLHSKQILHCDLKPSNVSISCSSGALRPRIKLANFAFRRRFKNPVPLWKLGTKCWMAPEIYDQDTFTSQMDIFSLGLLFAYVLSRGLHAFGSIKEESIIRIQMKQPMTMTVKQLQLVGAVFEVFHLITSMLNFNAEERPKALEILSHSFFKNSRLTIIENKSKTNALIPAITQPLNESAIDGKNGPSNSITEVLTESSMEALSPIRLPTGESQPKKIRLNETPATDKDLLHASVASPPLEEMSNQKPHTSDRSNHETALASTHNSPEIPTSLQDEQSIVNIAQFKENEKNLQNFQSKTDTETSRSTSCQSQAPSQASTKKTDSEDDKLSVSESEESDDDDSSSSDSNEDEIEIVHETVNNLTTQASPKNAEDEQEQIGLFTMRLEDRSNLAPQMPENLRLVDFCRTAQLEETALARLHRQLINTRIDINFAPPPDYMPPLLLLCQYSKDKNLAETLSILLKRRDLDIEPRPRSGYTGLMMLCKSYPHENIIECIQLLINRGVNVDAKERKGNWHSAVQLLCSHYSGKNLVDVALLLLCRTSCWNYPKKLRPQSILWDRKLKDEARKVANIIEQLHNGKRNPKELELMGLCSRPHLGRASIDRFNVLILDKTINLNCTDQSGLTPLLLLCLNNQSDSLYEHVQLLLQSERVNVHVTTRDRWNALLLACHHYGGKKLLEIVKLFIHQGIDVKQTNRTEMNALFALISNQSEEQDPRLFDIVKSLVDAGLDASAKCSGLSVFDNLTRKHGQHQDFSRIVQYLTKKEVAVNDNITRGYQNQPTILGPNQQGKWRAERY